MCWERQTFLEQMHKQQSRLGFYEAAHERKGRAVPKAPFFSDISVMYG